MTNLARTALFSSFVLALVAGCKSSDDTGTDTLGSNESQLVTDDSEASQVDDDLESGIDDPLAGGRLADPGTPADGATLDLLLENVRLNVGLFFQPAGCVVSTRDGDSLKHVFSHCHGPWGMADFDGTITSTFVRDGDKLTITHHAEGFSANGATISGDRVVVYTRSGAVITKTRTGKWTGTTAKGKDISHDASFVTTYDASTKCITRDGSAQTTIGGRSFERTIDGYKRCGIGRGGCPESGKLVLSRTKSNETLTLTVTFLGGTKVEITRPNGREVTRALICNPSA